MIAEETIRRLEFAEGIPYSNASPNTVWRIPSSGHLLGRFLGSLSVTRCPSPSSSLSVSAAQSPVSQWSSANQLVDTYFDESFSSVYRSTKDITGLSEQGNGSP